MCLCGISYSRGPVSQMEQGAFLQMQWPTLLCVSFVSGLAVTMDSCPPQCASQAKWCLHNISGWVSI